MAAARRSRQQWRSMILPAVIILTILGLIGASGLSYLSYRDATAQFIMERDRQVALLNAVRLRDELSHLADELQAMARSQSLYLGLTERQRLYLRGASQRLVLFDGGVILMDNNGRVRATVPERWDIMSDNWSNQEFFRSMLIPRPPEVHFSPVLDVGPDNTPVIVMSVPVLGENAEMVGVLSGLFRLGESHLSAFYASIVRLRLPGTGNTYIVDSTGRILYDSGYERIGEAIQANRPVAAGLQGSSLLTTDAEGNRVIAAYAPVPGTDWTLITETDWANAMGSVQRYATGMIVLLALGTIIPTLGVVMLARGQRNHFLDDDRTGQVVRLNAEMQQRLLPRHAPMLDGWDVGLHHHSAANGASAHDLYDFMLLPDGRLMVSLATVAAPGVGTIQLMAAARTAFRAAASRGLSAAQALIECNNLICPDLGPDSAITSLYALLDPSTGRIQIANAGFSPPLRWSGRELTELHEGDPFLGQLLDTEYDQDDVLLGPGESIILYSPGVLGVLPEKGEPFGPERVQSVLRTVNAATAQGIVDALRIDLNEFGQKHSLRCCDITFIALSRPVKAEQPEQRRRSLRDELRALGETEAEL